MSTLFSTVYYKQKPFISAHGIGERVSYIAVRYGDWVSEPVLHQEGLSHKILDFNRVYEANVVQVDDSVSTSR